jgi:putative effector of murein hydrolase
LQLVIVIVVVIIIIIIINDFVFNNFFRKGSYLQNVLTPKLIIHAT